MRNTAMISKKLFLFIIVLLMVSCSYQAKVSATNPPVHGDISVVLTQGDVIGIKFDVTADADFYQGTLTIKLPWDAELVKGEVTKKFTQVKKGQLLELMCSIREKDHFQKEIVGEIQVQESAQYTTGFGTMYVLELHQGVEDPKRSE